MFLMMIILWSIALVILITKRKSITDRWAAMIAFIGGFEGLGSFIGDVLIPSFLVNYIKNPDTISQIRSISRLIMNISCYFYYPYIMFAISYYRFKSFERPKVRNTAAVLLFIPIIILYLLFPIDSYYKPITIISPALDLGYIMTANVLLIINYYKETSPKLKREKLLVILMLIPVATLSFVFGSLMHYLGYHNMWKQEIWLFIYLAVIFFTFASKWGIIGIRIIFQDTEFHNTMQAINTGVLTLDHALKNETMKIGTCLENIKSSGSYKDDEIKWNVRIIKNSVDHLMDIAEKVKHKSKQVEVVEKPEDISNIIQNALKRVDIYKKEKKLNFNFDCSDNINVMCDPVLIEEALVNIFMNSIEAMKTGGVLSIQVINHNDIYIIKINDNGSGIPKEMVSKVFNPFFTTKNPVTNYGLGLSYCYNVFEKHGWNIELESQIGKGTTVYITIPKNVKSIKAV